MKNTDEEFEITRQAILMTAEGLEKESEELLRKSIPRFPNSAELRIQLASLCFDSKPDEARELVHKGMELSNNDPWLLYRAADLMFTLGDREQAVQYSKRAEELGDEDLLGSPGFSNLRGNVAVYEGCYEEAEHFLRDAFEREPTTAMHGLQLAALYRICQRFDEALEVIDKARRYRPQDQGLIDLRTEINNVSRG